MTTDTNIASYKKLCTTLYGCFALGGVLQLSPLTAMIGFIALLIAALIVESKKKKVVDPLYHSHFRWMSRTFWIGTGAYMPIAILISTGLILYYTDILAIMGVVESGAGSVSDVENYLAANMSKINLYLLLPLLPLLVWWLHRCWRGYQALSQHKTVDNITTWL